MNRMRQDLLNKRPGTYSSKAWGVMGFACGVVGFRLVSVLPRKYHKSQLVVLSLDGCGPATT